MPLDWLSQNQTDPAARTYVPEPASEDLALLLNVRSAPSLGVEGADGATRYFGNRWIDGRLGQAGIVVGAHFGELAEQGIGLDGSRLAAPLNLFALGKQYSLLLATLSLTYA